MTNRNNRARQGKDGQFQSGEPSTVERPEMVKEGRDPRTGEAIQNATSLPQDIKDKLAGFTDKYHEYHKRTNTAGAKKNPLFDIRMTPEKRFESFLDSEWNTFGSDIQGALKHALKCFEEQGEDIAGAWADRPATDNKSNR